MTVRIAASGAVELLGACSMEDAEPLLQFLLCAPPQVTVDWRGCHSAHAAIVQVLMAARPRLLGPPADAGLRAWVEPAIARP
jgi:hypothetical protein